MVTYLGISELAYPDPVLLENEAVPVIVIEDPMVVTELDVKVIVGLSRGEGDRDPGSVQCFSSITVAADDPQKKVDGHIDVESEKLIESQPL